MRYICQVCGYVYDDDKEKIPFNELPDDWICPLCGASKSDFKSENNLEEKVTEKLDNSSKPIENEMVELSFGALSCVCSNLAKGCEKQYLLEESKQYNKLADYFLSISKEDNEVSYEKLVKLVSQNLESNYKDLNEIATLKHDRGALRAKVWSEKVTTILKVLLLRYEKEKEKMFDCTKVFVCSVCGFIFIGDNPPENCPVCKVQSNKFVLIGGDEQ